MCVCVLCVRVHARLDFLFLLGTTHDVGRTELLLPRHITTKGVALCLGVAHLQLQFLHKARGRHRILHSSSSSGVHLHCRSLGICNSGGQLRHLLLSGSCFSRGGFQLLVCDIQVMPPRLDIHLQLIPCACESRHRGIEFILQRLQTRRVGGCSFGALFCVLYPCLQRLCLRLQADVGVHAGFGFRQRVLHFGLQRSGSARGYGELVLHVLVVRLQRSQLFLVMNRPLQFLQGG